MLANIKGPYCKHEFSQYLDTHEDDGDIVCDDVENCPHCEIPILFELEGSEVISNQI